MYLFHGPSYSTAADHCCGAVAFKLLIAHARILNRAIATALIA
jgi:acyl-coenzyme A thioesterase PaaI-like protein